MSQSSLPLPAPDSPAALLELVQCLTRALRDEVRQGAVAHGLLLVHWQALWFLRAANRYSNTAQALAAYLGQTKGSVSQTVRLLEARGFLLRRPDKVDRRVVRLELTDSGQSILETIDAGGNWQSAANGLPQRQIAAATTALSTLLRNWQQLSGGTSFGVCRSCARFQVVTDVQFRCGMTHELLDEFDSGQICQAHQVP